MSAAASVAVKRLDDGRVEISGLVLCRLWFPQNDDVVFGVMPLNPFVDAVVGLPGGMAKTSDSDSRRSVKRILASLLSVRKIPLQAASEAAKRTVEAFVCRFQLWHREGALAST